MYSNNFVSPFPPPQISAIFSPHAGIRIRPGQRPCLRRAWLQGVLGHYLNILQFLTYQFINFSYPYMYLKMPYLPPFFIFSPKSVKNWAKIQFHVCSSILFNFIISSLILFSLFPSPFFSSPFPYFFPPTIIFYVPPLLTLMIHQIKIGSNDTIIWSKIDLIS